MKPSLELPDPPTDSSQVVTAELVEGSNPRRWWRSRYVHWAVVGLVLLVALAIAVEPFVRSRTKIIMGDVCAARGQAKYYDGDLPGALEQLDTAVEWSPDDPHILLTRALMRFRNNDLEGSLADYDRVIQLSPTYSGGYAGRAQVYQRLGRYPDAISDLTTALRNQPAWEPHPWNHRAYVRALGGIELQEALEDVNEAIRLDEDENASFLDTRGLILHKLGKQDEALTDLNRAIVLTSAQLKQWQLQGDKDQTDPRLRKLRDEEYNHALAVMHQHRSLVHAALKHEAEGRSPVARLFDALC